MRGSLSALLLCAAVPLVAGCKGGDVGYAVRLTMEIDDSIPDADKDAITTLELQVRASGEMWYQRFPAGDDFKGRKAQIVYRPKLPSGQLPFDLRVRGGMDRLIGEGGVTVDLKPGATVDATVTIARPASADMGPPLDFMVGPDMSSPVDMAMPQGKPDLVMPQTAMDLAMPTPMDMAMPVQMDMATPAPADLAASD